MTGTKPDSYNGFTMKRLALAFLGFFIFFFSLFAATSLALAHAEDEPHEEATEEAEAEVNSYELFWPLVAGRTKDDGFVYSLKLLKEKIRGWFIFGAAQKADYQVFLGAKRVLEAEKLLGEDKRNLALKTLDKAVNHFDQARTNFEKAKQGGSDISSVQANIKNRLSNVEKLVGWLAFNASGETKTRLEQLREKVSVFLRELP